VHPLAGAAPPGGGAERAPVAAAMLALAALAACGGTPRRGDNQPATAEPATTQPAREPAVVEVQRGLATWYGRGTGTASGERFNKHALTAAHRTFPMNTRVRVTNQRNGRSVIVRINDRGPFARGRIIDVSEAAAVQLDMKRAGVVPVKVERLR
jgi:rare lipoprotein A